MTEIQSAKDRTKQWLQETYKKELGRDLDEGGAKYWTADIHDRGQTQDQVLANIKKSNEKWLVDKYKKDLGRDIDQAGREYWMGDFRGKGSGKEDLTYGSDRPVQTRKQVASNIASHTEYKDYKEDLKDKKWKEEQIKDGQIKDETFRTDNQEPKNYWKAVKYQDRPYNKNWDSVDAAADTGNQMTDDYYKRFLPQMRNEVLLGINEIGAAGRYHSDRYTGKPPTYTDPKELFDYYKNRTGSSGDSSNDTIKDLQNRIKELEKKYSIN